MASTSSRPSIPVETHESLSPHRLLLIFLLIAALLHFVLFLQTVSWSPASAPPRVEIQKIDPKKLQDIKQRWKEKSLLLDRDLSPKSETLAPEDARYFSDRNIRVEKEQRAKNTSPIVKPQTKPPSQSSEKSQSKTSAPPKSKPLPDLKMLGIQLPSQAPDRQLAQKKIEEGGAQYIPDKNLPEGTQNLLNAQESVFYSFYSRIYDAIGPLWQSKIRQTPHPIGLRDGDYSTLVDVVLDAAGNLVQVHLLQSSGVRDFDQTVDSSWRKLEKFPNPPQGLLNHDRQIHMGWTFTVHVSKGLFFEPPSRAY